MKLFGLNITRAKAMQSVAGGHTSWFASLETFPGSFQQDVPIKIQDVMTADPVYACITLIARDISKLPLRLVQWSQGIWSPAESAAFGPVIKKPNRYQTRIQFVNAWVVSKLGTSGNAYILKGRDARGIVTSMHVLDPRMVTTLVADDGEVFYQIGGDRLVGLGQTGITVPASEVIHDRCTPLHHPLDGVSPLYAAGLPATLGLEIQRSSARFFGGGARPGGILTAPGKISPDIADRIRKDWKAKFSGSNAGQIAVLGESMTFTPMTITAADSLTPDQAKEAAVRVCSAFHVPAWKIGAAPMPPYGNVQAGQVMYYADCLQEHIESIELLLDDGLGLNANGNAYGTEFEVDALLRMDTLTKVEAAAKAVGAAIKSPDEARREFNLGPVAGGATPYLQQQNYSLAALSKRDAKDDPFATAKPPAPPTPPAPEPGQEPEPEDDAKMLEEGLSTSARDYLRHLVEKRIAQAA
jgi:HK97 family phage portal protein